MEGRQHQQAADPDPHCTPPWQPVQSCRPPPPPGDAFHLTIRNILCARKNRRLGRRNSNNNNSYKQNKQFETRERTKTGTRQHQKGERRRTALQWRSLRRVECIGPKCPQRIFEFCQYLRSHSKIILIENLGVNWGEDSSSVPLGLSNADVRRRMAVDKTGQILQLDRCLSEWTKRMRGDESVGGSLQLLKSQCTERNRRWSKSKVNLLRDCGIWSIDNDIYVMIIKNK